MEERGIKMNRNVVLITGGTSGIGFATAKKFLEKGAIVFVGSIDSKPMVEKAMDILMKLGEVYYKYLDVTEENSCIQMVKYVKMKYGKVDVLVNAAGVRGKADLPTNTDFSDLERTMGINLMGTIRMATMAAVLMKQQRFGTIINIGSISGEMVTASDYGYHCSKAAVHMATKILAKEIAPYGVRCLAIAPAGVSAGMNSSDWEKEGQKLHIKKRLISAGEVADAIYLATTKAASAMNGSVLMLDDGYTAYKGIF